MLAPLYRYSRGNGARMSHSSSVSRQEPLQNFKNKALFLILLGIALLFYGAALAYMK